MSSPPLIDTILEIIKEERYEHESFAIIKLTRGLSVALTIKDEQRIEAVRDSMIIFEDKIAQDNLPGSWGFCFDYLIRNKKVKLTEEQKRKIVDDLENRLKRISERADPDLHATEAATIRLAQYYRKKTRLMNQIERYDFINR